MRVKFWLASTFHSIIKSIRIRPNRFQRRRWKKRCAARASAALLAGVVMTSPSFTAGQCIGPLFPGQSFAVGDYPNSVTAGDFNGDGLTDLATAHTLDDILSVVQGNGDGTFQAPQTFPVGASPLNVTTDDFNGDGLIDLATANTFSVSVLLNQCGSGSGTYRSPLFPLW